MANRVQGKNIIGSMNIDDTYYPIFCGKTLSFNLDQDELETTSVNSGVSREYIAGMANAVMNITGVTILDNTESRISIAFLQQQSIRQAVQEWQIQLTDDDGSIIYYLFEGIIRNTSFTKALPGYSQSDLTVRITGDINITTIAPPPPPGSPEIIYSDWWTMDAGNTYIDGLSDVHGYGLQGVTILEVDREGANYDIITSGTPGNRQATHNNTTGVISFDPTNPSMGETVFVLFKVIL